MDQIALNWLVYQLTGSAIHLGVLDLCRLMPILLFTLIGGVVADRVERRRLLFITNVVSMLLALVLAILVSTGLVEIWMVLLIAVGRGVMLSFNQPVRQALIAELVPRETLMNAIGLSSAMINLTRLLGPAIGAGMIATIGIAGAFYANATSFLAVLSGLALMRIPERCQAVQRSILSDLVGGVRYLGAQPELRTLVLLALLPMVFGMPYITMLTVFAREVLRVSGAGLSLLTACSGAGALLGALFVASCGNTGHGRRFMLAGLIGFGLALMAFSLSHWIWFSVLTLIVVGFSQQVYTSLNNALIQKDVDEEYRGRILSILFLSRGMVPLGTMLAGYCADTFGVQATAATMAATLVFTALVAKQLSPRQERSPRPA